MADQAATATPQAPLPRATFTGLAIASMAAMLGIGILLPILPNFAEQLGASGAVVGFIFAGNALARTLFSPILGQLSDQYGRKNMILTGLFLYALLSIGYSILHQLWLLAIIWFAQGAASAMVTVIAQSYVGNITPEGKEGRILNLFYLAQFIGAAIGPVIGGFLTDHISTDAPFYLMGGVALVALIIVAFMVPKLSLKEKDELEEVPFKESFLAVIKDRKMKGLLSYVIGRGFYRRGFNTFFPIYAVTIASLSNSQVGLILSSYKITGTLLQYPFGWLADRWPGYRAEMLAIGGSMAAMTIFFIPSFTRWDWLILLIIIKGGFSAVSRASTVAVRTERGRIYGMGAVTGAYIAGASAGQVLGPIGFGAIADTLNLSSCFYIGAIAGLLTTGLAYWYLHVKSNDNMGDPA